MNTEAATVLYDTVSKLLNVSKMTTVMDICCGTGTQGLMAARKARGVIGIELSRSAVEDARFNAQLNGIHNTEFYVGRVEKLFQPVTEQLNMVSEISAIVNPTRAGVRKCLIFLILNFNPMLFFVVLNNLHLTNLLMELLLVFYFQYSQFDIPYSLDTTIFV